MSSPNARRVPAGSPEGGQFAAGGGRGESGFDLAGPSNGVDDADGIAMLNASLESGHTFDPDEIGLARARGWNGDTFAQGLEAGDFDDGVESAPRMLDLNTPEIDSLLRSSKAATFHKVAIVRARRAEAPERLETRLDDGTLETTREVARGEWVVTNSRGEQYAMSHESFTSQYAPRPDGGFAATGSVVAAANPSGEHIAIRSPGGELMRGKPDCMLAATEQADGSPGDNRYLIDSDAFAGTYARTVDDPDRFMAQAVGARTKASARSDSNVSRLWAERATKARAALEAGEVSEHTRAFVRDHLTTRHSVSEQNKRIVARLERDHIVANLDPTVRKQLLTPSNSEPRPQGSAASRLPPA